MTVWDLLRAEITRLRDERPSPLKAHPDPRGDDHPLPAHVGLAAWASGEAERLHRRFGDDVILTVGAMSYPDATDQPAGEQPADIAPPDELAVALDAPLTVHSGHDDTARLLITNHTNGVMRVNGGLTAVVTEPGSGRVVGGYAGFLTLQLITYTIQPAATVPVPLLVGTTSKVAALGYAIPPGHWNMHTTLSLGDGRRLRTPALPITIN
jgi:hypothetical protein